MKGKEQVIILVAGMTGLAAGYGTGLPVYEAENYVRLNKSSLLTFLACKFRINMEFKT
jgi:hypothetical protein